MKKVISIFLVMIILLSSLSVLSFAYNQIDTYAEVLAEIREQMMNRENSISFRYQGSKPLDEINVEEVFSLDYTSSMYASPVGGDYLRLNVASYTEPVISQDGTVSMNVSYYTTKEQEEVLMEAIYDEKIGLDKSSFVGKSTDKIIETIFNFICNNVSYDEEHYFDDSYTLKHTAYAAFFNKKAVCQGYALLFQLMAREAGIESRIVLGYKKGENHAWNIVKLDDKWYSLDATYGAGFEDRTAYFLKGSLPNTEISYEDGFTPSEISEYALSSSDYTEPEHNYVLTSSTEATCTEDGKSFFTCSDCGKTKTVTHTKALGHSFDNRADEECNVCGYARPSWSFDETTGALVFSGSGSTEDCDSFDDIKLSVKSIDIGEGSIAINSSAFSGMENLETVDLGNATTIGSNAFENCKALEYIEIPESVTYLVVGLAFKGCESLEAFGSTNSKLTADEDGVLWFGDVLYMYPPGNPREEYHLRDRGIAAIAENAFYSANNLKLISLENGKTGSTDTIHTNFYGGSSYVTLNSFRGEKSYVNTGVIKNCENLEKVILADHLNIADTYVFNCSKLKEFYIGSATSEIKRNPFIYCDSLEKIVVDSNNPYFHSDDKGALYSKDTLISCPGGYKYKTYTTPGDISKIGHTAFHHCLNIETIEFTENIETINYSSVFVCDSLKSLIFRNPEVNIINNGLVIMIQRGKVIEVYGFKDSTAETLVEKHNVTDISFYEYIFREICPLCKAADSSETPRIYPTCYSVGYTKGLKCNNCSYYYYGHEEIAMVGHADDDIDRYCDFCGISVMFDDRGKMGDDIYWRVFESGILWLYGSGEAYSYIPTPWSEYEDDFDIVYSEGVINNLPGYFFVGCDNIEYVLIPSGMDEIETCGECIAYTGNGGNFSLEDISGGVIRFDIYDLLNCAAMLCTTYQTVSEISFDELVFESAEEGVPVTYNILHNGKRISEDAYTIGTDVVLRDISFNIKNHTFEEYILTDPDSFKESVYLMIKSDDLLTEEMKGAADEYACEILLHFIEEEPETPDEPDIPDVPDEPDIPDEPDTPDTPDEPETPKKETIMDKFMGFINSIMNVFRKILKIFSK